MIKASVFFAASLLATILFVVRAPSTLTKLRSTTETFSFVSMGDGQAAATNFATTVNQIATLQPDLVIFNGDLENNGVISTEMNPMVTAIKNAGLFNQTFLVRGNHDNQVSGSATLWESYFETSPNIKVLPAGVTNYVSLNSSSDYLNYSFIYGNAMFIGLDVPGDVSLLTSTQLTFLDTRLTYAESQGLVHAFIYFHGPLYCVESIHCSCTSKTNASCTPSTLVTVLNKHPIVSATFHGHEHILGWTHMDNTRVASLTGNFEQFITSPSGGGTYNSYLYPARMDYTYLNMGSSQGFAAINVNGCSFTFSIYKVGTTASVWSKTFTKGICPTPTWTATQTYAETDIFTPTTTFTFTPSRTLTATYTPSPTKTFPATRTKHNPKTTATHTYTATQTFTSTETFTFTPSDTLTATYTPSPTKTVTPTSTTTSSDTFTPTHTLTNTAEPTQTPTLTPTLYTLYLSLIIMGNPSP